MMKPLHKTGVDSPIRRLPLLYRDRGILKPKKLAAGNPGNAKRSSILGKFSDFFNKYSISNYESNIDISDLEKLYTGSRGHGEIRPILKRARFDDSGKYETKYSNYSRNSRNSRDIKAPLVAETDTIDDRYERQERRDRVSGVDWTSKLEIDDLKSQINTLNRRVSDSANDTQQLLRDKQSLARQIEVLETEIAGLKGHNETKTKELAAVNRRNYTLIQQSIDLTTEIDKLQKSNKELADANNSLKHDLTSITDLQLKLVETNYLLTCKTLEVDRQKYNLSDDPKFTVNYYKLANEKLNACEAEFNNYKLFKHDKLYIDTHYNYDRLVGLKVALNNLNADLVARFERRVEKSMAQYGTQEFPLGITNHLSCLYKLRLKISHMLYTIDEIITILKPCGPS